MRWEYDPGLSQVSWAVKYLGIAVVKGFFNKVEVAVELDEDQPSRSSLAAKIDVRSMDSGVPDRDKHLLTPDYFDAEQYPTITFQSRRVERDGDQWRAVGDLTMHGVTKEVELRGTSGGDATDPRGNYRRGFSASTTVNRNEFGVGAGSAAQDVQVFVESQLIRRE